MLDSDCEIFSVRNQIADVDLENNNSRGIQGTECNTNQVQMSTKSFYNTRNGKSSIPDWKKKLIKSHVSTNPDETQEKQTRSVTFAGRLRSGKHGKNNFRKVNLECRQRKQNPTLIQTRPPTKERVSPYDFSSSSVESSGSCIANLSTKSIEPIPCNNQSTTKRFFTSRPPVSDDDDKLTTIWKGKHFHLAFTRGSNEKTTFTKKNTKLCNNTNDKQKRKKKLLSSAKRAKSSRIPPTKQYQLPHEIKPLSIVLTKENFSHYISKLVSEQNCHNSSSNDDAASINEASSFPAVENSLKHQETTKENVDPIFYTSTPLKAGGNPCLVMDSCSPMKKIKTPEFSLGKLNYDLKSSSKENNSATLPNVRSKTAENNRNIANIKYFSRKDANDPSQLIIDAGQKNLGAKQCITCHMLYNAGNLQDEKTHKKYHESYIAKLKLPAWKKERILGEFGDGKIVMIMSSDAKYMLQKVKDIQEVVDKELGVSCSIQTKSNASYVLFIAADRTVAGFAVIEKISKAYRVISDPNIVGYGSPRKVLYCEREPVPAFCGICRLWTSPEYRRHKIATRMLDCLRCHFIFGYLLSTDEIAFLDPTIDGRQFIERYIGTPNYLVYFKTMSA